MGALAPAVPAAAVPAAAVPVAAVPVAAVPVAVDAVANASRIKGAAAAACNKIGAGKPPQTGMHALLFVVLCQAMGGQAVHLAVKQYAAI